MPQSGCEDAVGGPFAFGGRAILPAAGFQPALAARGPLGAAAAAKIGRPPEPNGPITEDAVPASGNSIGPDDVL